MNAWAVDNASTDKNKMWLYSDNLNYLKWQF
jgi:hypothetical protein